MTKIKMQNNADERVAIKTIGHTSKKETNCQSDSLPASKKYDILSLKVVSKKGMYFI